MIRQPGSSGPIPAKFARQLIPVPVRANLKGVAINGSLYRREFKDCLFRFIYFNLNSEVEQVVLVLLLVLMVLENSRYLAVTLIKRNSAGIFVPCFDAESQPIEHDFPTSESGFKSGS